MASDKVYAGLGVVKNIPGVDPVTIGIKAAATITEAILSIADMAKRRRIEAAIALVDNADKIRIANQMAGEKDLAQRVDILENSLYQYGAMAQAEQQKAAKIILIGGIVVASLFLMVVIFYNKKAKS